MLSNTIFFDENKFKSALLSGTISEIFKNIINYNEIVFLYSEGLNKRSGFFEFKNNCTHLFLYNHISKRFNICEDEISNNSFFVKDDSFIFENVIIAKVISTKKAPFIEEKIVLL